RGNDICGAVRVLEMQDKFAAVDPASGCRCGIPEVGFSADGRLETFESHLALLCFTCADSTGGSLDALLERARDEKVHADVCDGKRQQQKRSGYQAELYRGDAAAIADQPLQGCGRDSPKRSAGAVTQHKTQARNDAHSADFEAYEGRVNERFKDE